MRFHVPPAAVASNINTRKKFHRKIANLPTLYKQLFYTDCLTVWTFIGKCSERKCVQKNTTRRHFAMWSYQPTLVTNP